ncbi:MAG: pirin family protein [Pseudomonadota bacterium]
MSWNPCPDPVLGQRETVNAIDTLIVPRAVDLGEMTVRRALPSVERQMVGPFIFFDQMGPAEFLTDQGIDVRPHPHINLSTLTYLFEGQILHRDSLGTEITIEPGEINWMTAGKGIVHSERTTAAKKASGQKLFGLQTWMALPADKEETAPDFRHFGKEELPIVEDHGIRVRLIAGAAFGGVSPLNAPSETLYADIRLEAGTSVPIDPTVEERALYTINGDIEIDGEIYAPGQLIVLRSGASLTVTAKTNSRVMLFGGAPMKGPRYIWWNFVSSRLDRIEQAKEEWARGQFDTVPGDEEEFIPLPADVGKPRKAFGSKRD